MQSYFNFKKLAAHGALLKFIRACMHLVIGREYVLKVNEKICPKSSVPQESHIGPIRSSCASPGAELNRQKLGCMENFTYLGVKFDRKMTFNKHVSQAAANSVRTANAAARLCRYIGNRAPNIRLFSIYNAPKIQYASVIWSRGTATQNKVMSEGHRRATRCALSTPHRPHLPGYRSYAQRCATLRITTLKQSRDVSTALLCAKILKNEI